MAALQNAFPRGYTTKCLCWCTPGKFSDPRYIQGRIGMPAPEIIDAPPYKDAEFERYVSTDNELIYMDDRNPLESRNNYITGVARRNNGHLYGPIDILLNEETFYGLNNDYVLDCCRCDKFLLIEFELEGEIEGSPNPNNIKIIGILSGNFTHIRSYLDNQEIVFKRSAIVNLLITRNGHSGCGTNLMTKYLKMLKSLEVNVCFLEAVPEAFYFYLKYDFCLTGSYREEKYGTVDEKELFAIDLNVIDLDDVSKHPPCMQRFASNNKSKKRKMSTNHHHSALKKIGINPILLENSKYYIRYREYLRDIERLNPLDRWPFLTMCLMAKSPTLKGYFSSSAVQIKPNPNVNITYFKKGKPNGSNRNILNIRNMQNPIANLAPLVHRSMPLARVVNHNRTNRNIGNHTNARQNGYASNSNNVREAEPRPRGWFSWLRSFQRPFSWVS
jgi:hypothetical protein